MSTAKQIESFFNLEAGLTVPSGMIPVFTEVETYQSFWYHKIFTVDGKEISPYHKMVELLPKDDYSVWSLIPTDKVSEIIYCDGLSHEMFTLRRQGEDFELVDVKFLAYGIDDKLLATGIIPGI